MVTCQISWAPATVHGIMLKTQKHAATNEGPYCDWRCWDATAVVYKPVADGQLIACNVLRSSYADAIPRCSLFSSTHDDLTHVRRDYIVLLDVCGWGSLGVVRVPHF